MPVLGSGSAASAENVTTVAASGTAQTFTLDSSGVGTWDVTLTGNCTVTLGGATAGKACTVTLILRQDGTGNRTVTWPGSVNWTPSGGTAPTLSSAGGAADVVSLWSDDGGTTWLGFAGSKAGSGWTAGSAGWFRGWGAGTNVALASANTLTAHPVDLGAATITQLAVNVTTGAATAIMRIGIYADSNGYPGALLVEPTSVTQIDASTTGQKTTGTFSQSVTGRVWLATVAQVASPTVTVQNGIYTPGVGYNTVGNAFGSVPTGYIATGAVSGALPTTFTVNGATTTTFAVAARVG